MKKGQSLAEHGILALKTSSVLYLWRQPGFNRKTVLKRDIPTSVQHILTLTGKDFRFIENRNLKQKTLLRVLWMADFQSHGEPGTTTKTDPVW